VRAVLTVENGDGGDVANFGGFQWRSGDGGGQNKHD
jgi:hypothetical protein